MFTPLAWFVVLFPFVHPQGLDASEDPRESRLAASTHGGAYIAGCATYGPGSASGRSIQTCIDQARDGQRVEVLPGVYNESIDFKGKAIEVVGVGGPLVTTIDASGTRLPGVTFHNGEGLDSVLRGFTITGAQLEYGRKGGGVSATSIGFVHAFPLIQDCIIRGNRTSYGEGGGVAGAPTMERCVVVDNRASDGEGGGLSGAPRMRDCVVARNYASNGGGAYVVLGSASFENTVFVDNNAHEGARGGAVLVNGTASASFLNTVLAENGVHSKGFYPTGGGAIHVWPGGDVDVFFSTIVDNRATCLGYAEYGGIFGDCSLVNTVVRNNDGVQFVGQMDIRYSNIEGGYAGIGNFDADPLFVDQAGRDYHLSPDSPCIDNGDPGLFDPDGTRSDVGAFHYQSLYHLWNTIPSSFLDPAWSEIPLDYGGKHRLGLDAGPGCAGGRYQIVGTMSGTSPGFQLNGLTVPVNPDPYSVFTLRNPNGTLLSGFAGTLDAEGRGAATIALPPISNRALLGRADHAFGVFHSGVLSFVSNPEGLQVIP